MSLKKVVFAQVILLVLFAALLAVGSVYDSLIAEKLYTGEGFIVLSTEALGKMPLFLAGSLACAVAFYTVKKPDSEAKDGEVSAKTADKKRADTAWYAIKKGVFCLGGAACAAFMFKDVFDLITEESLMSLAMCGMAGVALFVLFTIILPRVPREKIERAKYWAIAVIIAVVLIAALTQGVKMLWGRARPFEVAEGAPFTAWYTPSDFGGESFFSGHAACCMGILLFAPLLTLNDDEPVYRVIYFILSFVFIACTMLGRLMGGHHYLTDVAAGAIISIAVMSVVCDAVFCIRRGKTQGHTEKDK